MPEPRWNDNDRRRARRMAKKRINVKVVITKRPIAYLNAFEAPHE
jgi:hypothetical protein